MGFVTAPIVGIDLTQIDTVPTQTLGTEVEATDGTYRYIQANGAISQYAMCKIDDSDQAVQGTTTLLPSTEPAMVGIAQVAFADNEYGWIHRGNGSGSVLVSATCAADVKLYTTATAGKVEDNSSGTVLIQGLKLKTALAASGTGSFLASGLLATAS